MTGAAECCALTEIAVDEPAHDRADDQRDFQSRRQINPHTDSQRRQSEGFRMALEQHIYDNSSDAYDNAKNDVIPIEAGAENALCNSRHQRSLRSGEGL